MAEYCLICPSQISIGTTQSFSMSSCVCGGCKNVCFGHKFVPVPQQNAFIFGKQKSTLGESALRTYAATRDTRNLLLLHYFFAASEILEILLKSKIKLYNIGHETVRWGASNCEWMIHVQYFQPDICWPFFSLKSAVQTTPTKWLLKP